MNHIAVIGAGFGDEGKGQVVDYLASQGNHETVVRFSGGSQSGHTVTCPDGTFTFAQVGSGALSGVPTHISRFMLINPVYLLREVSVLESLGVRPLISIDPRTRFIVPADIEANQQREVARGVARHGSVGHGVAHAVRRSAYPDLRLTAVLASRQAALTLCKHARIFHSLLTDFVASSDDHHYAAAVEELMGRVTIRNDEDVTRNPCIFEGSQGLLLDQNSGFFPYVTPSNTGMTNVCTLLARSRIPVKPIYVTRTYLTRHGPGPMYLDWVPVKGPAREGAEHVLQKDGATLPDGTNPPNEWQGALRYARLSIAQMRYAIARDYEVATTADLCQVRSPRLAVTWANSGAQAADSNIGEAYEVLRDDAVLVASGPDRESVRPSGTFL